jgi:hypothetical protein
VTPASLRLVATGLLGVALAGCRASQAVFGDDKFFLTESRAIPSDVLGLALAAYWVIDPLAPNWQGQVQELGAGRYRIVLLKKRFAGGGDGEGVAALERQAQQLAIRHGGSYRVLSQREGVESTFPAPQRYLEAVIQAGDDGVAGGRS